MKNERKIAMVQFLTFILFFQVVCESVYGVLQLISSLARLSLKKTGDFASDDDLCPIKAKCKKSFPFKSQEEINSQIDASCLR